jgi:dimeric dUTPase (all-alpha-NTP-PPase superfamily)
MQNGFFLPLLDFFYVCFLCSYVFGKKFKYCYKKKSLCHFYWSYINLGNNLRTNLVSLKSRAQHTSPPNQLTLYMLYMNLGKVTHICCSGGCEHAHLSLFIC